MKKLLCFLLCLTLIFSSISLCFASPTSWDTADQANLRAIKNLLDSGGGIYNMISTISSRTNTISNTLTDIKGLLSSGNHSIAYLVDSILTWMSPIYNALTALPVDLNSIKSGLWKPLSNGSEQAYLSILDKALAAQDNWTSTDRYYNAHAQLVNSNGVYQMPLVPNGTLDGSFNMYDRTWTQGSPIGNVAYLLHDHMINSVRTYHNRWLADLTGYNTTQNVVNWSDIDSTYTFTPQSATDGLYKFLSSIQAPVARLSYVLASDERIEAQEAAAANEQAVVDNFIDSSGDGATSPSDIGSVSDLSSGYKQNFGTDASPSGIFDIFNADHASWFSQETKNQLDTTTPTRLTKGSQSETPLLDKQIEDIYNALGVKQP